MRRVLTAAAVAVVSVASGVLVLTAGQIAPSPVTVINERPGESKAIVLPDGGRGYFWPATLVSDGGGTLVLSEVAPCVRRPLGASVESCSRLLSDAGIIDPGALNRFPATEAVGWTCQPVACSVVAGENPDNPEGWP